MLASLAQRSYSSNILLAFNEFIHEREVKPATDPSIMLFDQVILSKRNRGRTSMFSKSKTNFLSDNSDHLWRSAAANPPKGRFPGDYRAIVTRSKLNTTTDNYALECLLKRDASPRKTRPYPDEGTSSHSRGSTYKYHASTKEAYPQHAWAQQKDEWTGTVASIN